MDKERTGKYADEKKRTYWNYLRVEDLLQLQSGFRDTEDQVSEDEKLFIIVHQIFELWFKLALAEVRMTRDKLSESFVPEETIPHVVHHLRRVAAIFQSQTAQWKIMETLTPQDFLAFRSDLGTASGFQSVQNRELETVLGLGMDQRSQFFEQDPVAALRKIAEERPDSAFIQQRIDNVLKEVTLRDALHNWLYRTPIYNSSPDDANDEEVTKSWIDKYVAEHQKIAEHHVAVIQNSLGAEKAAQAKEKYDANVKTCDEFLNAKDIESPEQRKRVKRIRAAVLFIESYRDLPLLAWPRLLLDTIAEVEEQLVLFRSHHARMVERVIGRRVGTGGSSGVDYLDETAKMRIYPELWVVRAILLPKANLPAFEQGNVKLDCVNDSFALNPEDWFACVSSGHHAAAVFVEMANHGPAYGDLAATLAKRDGLYDRELEAVIQQWIESKIGEKFPDTFAASLKDGVRLCKLLNAIRPGSCKPGKPGKMPFLQMENITNFLNGCKNLGLSEVDLFVTVDLYEAKNMLQVQHCLDKLRIKFDGGAIVGLAPPSGDVFQAVAEGTVGKQETAPTPVTQAAPTAAPTAPVAEAPVVAKFCPECGAPTAGARFCSGCGYKLQ